jgi:hypothetical protein
VTLSKADISCVVTDDKELMAIKEKAENVKGLKIIILYNLGKFSTLFCSSEPNLSFCLSHRRDSCAALE